MKAHDDYVLLVEDNPDDAELTLLSFKKNKYPHEMVVVRDGAEALDFLFGAGLYLGRDKNRLPRLILLDLNLPKVQGLEVLKRIRAVPFLKHIPMVILTSSNVEKDRTEANILGATLYIRKPINLNDFADVVRQINNLPFTPN